MTSLFGSLSLLKNTNTVTIQIQDGLSTSYVLKLPASSPSNDSVPVWNSTLGSFSWVDMGSLGGDSGISAISVPPPLTSLIVGGTAVLDFESSSPANRFLASPSSTDGRVGLRAISQADVPSLDASKISSGTIAPAQMPASTPAVSWMINNQIMLKVDSQGQLTLYQADGTTLSSLKVDKIIAESEEIETHTEIASEETKIRLNTDFALGVPTENLGLVGLRGDESNTQLLWVEASKQWQAGVVGSMLPIALTFAVDFTNADLVGGILTVTHNLNSEDLIVSVKTNEKRDIGITTLFVDSNTISLDFSAIGTITGTWRVIIK